MCTLSILRISGEAGGYDLWFNRDERLVRAAETPPVRHVSARGTRFVAPGDGERGGTWLMLNERGLTVCVLNDYEAGGAAAAGATSRGRLPLVCADDGDAAGAVAAARAWTEAIPASGAVGGGIGAYWLVATDEAGEVRALGWDGRVWRERGAVEFISSSSHRSAEVRRFREAAHASLAAGGRTAERLARLHWAHDVAAGAESVRMRRPDACTRSVCVVRVRRGAERGLVYTAVDWEEPDGRGSRTEVGL